MSVPLADRRSRPGPGRGGTGSYCWATGLASTAGRIPAAILALTPDFGHGALGFRAVVL
jgi:hypothetical protein